MSKLRSLSAALVLSTAYALSPSTTHAGPISDENAKAGTRDWELGWAGNAQTDGLVDAYPASWSLRRGETVTLKVRSTSTYSVRVYRIGYYGGEGGRSMVTLDNRPADPQPYPSVSDPQTGLVHAGWHDSVSFQTDSSWMPGLYVAKIKHSGGREAMTYFTLRDDGASPKMPILLLVTAATHQAYNGWPGPTRGGKSLYGFNSSAVIPALSDTNQAVKVSRDRPFLVGGGTADVLRYEYPFLRWAEKNGYDVAVANDEDLERDPAIAQGRRAIVFSGHWEYVSRAMYDAVENARNAGTHLLFMSGDTLAMQVRYEDGGRTMVGFKEFWKRDPEQLAAEAAAARKDWVAVKEHLLKVTRGWKGLGYHPDKWGIDLRRPGIGLTGVLSYGGFKDVVGPWGNLRITNVDAWFFEGTGFKVGDVVKNIMGYEYDSMLLEEAEWNSFRPAGQIKTGALERKSDNLEVGSTSYYKHSSGADVVAMSAVNFAYVLDDWAAIGWPETSVDPRMQKLVSNLMTKWSSGAATPSLPAVEPIGTDAGAPIVDATTPVSDTSIPIIDAWTPIPGVDTGTPIPIPTPNDGGSIEEDGNAPAPADGAPIDPPVGDDAGAVGDEVGTAPGPDAGGSVEQPLDDAASAANGGGCTYGSSGSGAAAAVLAAVSAFAMRRRRSA